MHKWIKIVSVLFIIALQNLSIAIAYNALPKGWYIEGNVGATHTTHIEEPSSYTHTNDNINGWGVNAGYKFNPFFAAEIGLVYPDDLSSKNAAGLKVANNNRHFYDVAIRAMYPLSSTGFDIFAKIGAARLRSNISVTNRAQALNQGYDIDTGKHPHTGLFLGAGAEYAFLPYLLGNLQWERAYGDNRTTGTIDFYSAGLAYIFG